MKRPSFLHHGFPQVRRADAQAKLAPAADLVNTFEFEDAARQVLPPPVFDTIRDPEVRPDGRRDPSDPFERLTFRPRLVVDVRNMDLQLELLGTSHLAPLIIGPAPQHGRFHPQGELATAAAAKGAHTVMTIHHDSSKPLAEIADALGGPFYFAINDDTDPGEARTSIADAARHGATAVFIRIGSGDWETFGRLREASRIPVVAHGILTPEDAHEALIRQVDAIVVARPRRTAPPGALHPLVALEPIVEEVADGVPILYEGGIRRGGDAVKALALGARAVLLTRPAMWAISAYGDDGLWTMLEMLQTHMASDMAMCGKPNLAALDRTLVRWHRI